MAEKNTVLHLINSLEPGGAENLLYSQIPYFNINKYEIHVGFLQGKGKNFEDLSDIKLIDFSSKTNFTFVCIFKILYHVITNKINIIHTHLIQASIIGRLIALLVPGVKCVTTRHYARAERDHRFIHRLEDYSERYCHAIICISKYVKTHLIKKGINKSKLHVIYNGIDIDSFNSVELDNGHDVIIGTIARLNQQKGVDMLITAFQKVLIKYPKAKLEIIGDGPQKDQLNQMLVELGMVKNVIFYGEMLPVNIKEIIRRWKMLVLATRMEGFGLVLIEANAIGLPVVATNIDAIPELISDGVNGYLATPEDADDLFEKVMLLLNDPARAKLMGDNGKTIVKQQFSLKILIDKTERLYHNIL